MKLECIFDKTGNIFACPEATDRRYKFVLAPAFVAAFSQDSEDTLVYSLFSQFHLAVW